MRAVAELVKGMSINEAEAQLIIQKRRAASILLKLLRSGVAGAKNNKMDVSKLFVASFRVDQGPMLKRILPRAHGSADPIHKKMSHVLLILEERDGGKNRFVMAKPKKKKSAASDTGRKKERKAEKPENESKRQEKRGFFRKMFSRKAI